MIRTREIITKTILLSCLLAVSLHAQNGVTENTTNNELNAYIDAVIAIQQIQQDTQRNMWETVISAEMELETYFDLYQKWLVGQGIDQNKSVSQTRESFRSINEAINKQEQDLQVNIILAIEQNGLKTDRFYSIWTDIADNRLLRQNMEQMLMDKRRETISGNTTFAGTEPSKSESTKLSPDYPEFIIHVTEPGDNLFDLAKQYFENPLLWIEIYENNKNQIDDPSFLSKDVLLKIPVDHMHLKPGALLSSAEKLQIIRKIFHFSRFRSHSFAYISQRQQLKKPLKIYSSVDKVEQQIQNNHKLRHGLINPPDFLKLLLHLGEPAEEENKEPEITLNNMLIDETRSPFGSDFFEHFYSIWEFPEQTDEFHIKIIEKATPGKGSHMVIEVNREVVYQFHLQPGYEQIVELAEAVSKGLHNYLINFEEYAVKYF